MAVIPYLEVRGPNGNMLAASPIGYKATFVADNDTTSWIYTAGDITLRVANGTTFTVELHQALEADQSDAVVVDTQVETQRAANYTFNGPCYTRLKLTAHTGALPTIHMSTNNGIQA